MSLGTVWELTLAAPLGAPLSSCRSSYEKLPSMLLLVKAPTEANGSCYRAHKEASRKLTMGALRFLLMESPNELLYEALRERLERI